MYIASYELDDSEIFQILTKIQPSNPCVAETYRVLTATVLQVMKSLALSAGIRVIVDGRVSFLLLCTVHSNSTVQLKSELMTLQRELEGLADLKFSEHSDEHDGMLSEGVETHFRITPSNYKVNDWEVATNFKVAPFMKYLINVAQNQQEKMCYQWQVSHLDNAESCGRAAKKRVLRFEDEVSYIPPKLLTLEQDLANKLNAGRFIFEEVFSISETFQDYAKSYLQDEFDTTLSKYGFYDLPLLEDDLAEDTLLLGLPLSHLHEFDLVDLMGMSLTRDDLNIAINDLIPNMNQALYLSSSKDLDGSSFEVFVSYSSRNRNESLALCHGLEEAGIKCWIAPRDILSGESYPAAIMRGIKEVKVVVLVFSEHSNSSQHVHREIERSVSLGKIIIPFKIEEAGMSNDMEYLISACHWLDAVNPPLEQHIEILKNNIEKLISV